jgi:DNA polymerase III delta prime subunit
MIADRYKPTTQKALFHKDIVSHIRKWIKMVEDYSDNSRSVKQILFLYGPIGCSKTVTVECLFKGYNLINVDSDNIRSSEKISEVIQGIVGFREITLANIDKWNHKNRKDKSNVLWIDNLELCDRGIENFIESVHEKHNIDIPIIMVCNSSKYKDLFVSNKNCTFLEFKRPSLLELSKLASDIVTQEHLGLSKDQIRMIIDKSEFDVRQLLFLLQQWSLSKNTGSCFGTFIETIQVKHTDQDLSEKLEFLFNNRREFKLTDIFKVASSEPQSLSNSIYQNYINIPVEENFSLTPAENIVLLSNYSHIIDSISESNLIHSEIYENQNWNLYNDYTFHSTVVPSYYLKKNNQIFYNKYFATKTEIDDCDIREWNDKMYEFAPFKDISYNFINSYQEVKRISSNNMYSHVLNPAHKKPLQNSHILKDPLSCFTIVRILVHCMEDLNEYFNTNKRGKNTSKKEKLDLCDNITTGSAKISLDILVNNIYDYKLFEIDTDDFLINKSKYTDDDKIKQSVQKIDLRVFKRLLNIFTMDDKHKTFKSHIETSLQYKILQRLVNEYSDEPAKLSHDINNILTEDLDKIWNLS